jgi:ProP effector
METKPNSSKPNSSKDLIAYLAEKFPACFSLKGAAKPLKIGIFQELAEQLADDENVSKTRLRQALRHYTSSWRYLKSIKLGAQRINLQGEEVAEIDKEQADYASKTLKESQEKFAQKHPQKKNIAQQGTKSDHKRSDKAESKETTNKTADKKQKAKFNAVKSTKSVAKKPAVKLEKIEQSTVKVGQRVKVQIGNSPMDATVEEVIGNDVSVQLSSGMVVKTKLANLYIESKTDKK